MIIHFIRHAKSEANQQRIMQGHMNSPLSQEGIEQSIKLSKRLPEFDLVFASPLDRVKQTAMYSLPDNTEIIYLDELKEINVGVLEGARLDELTDEQRRLWDGIKSYPDFDEHNGEVPREFAYRCKSALDIIMSTAFERKAEVILAYTHSGVIQTLANHIFKLPITDDNKKNTGIFSVELVNNNWKKL